MIASAILVFGRIAHALFDIGVSCSFISSTYVKIFEFAMRVLDELIYVTTPGGRYLVSDHVCKSCKLRRFVVDLIVLGIED